MTERIQKKHQTHKRETEAQPEPQATDHHVADELDSLLDEVDSVLESDAQTFVDSYIQRGGQ